MHRRTRTASIVMAMILVAMAGPAAVAGSGKPSGCTTHEPRVVINNTWAWASKGSWGMPGQTITYALFVANDDVGCKASTFQVSVHAPQDFTVSIPTEAIQLDASSSGYVWADVTSGKGTSDGDFKLEASVQRSGSAAPVSIGDESWYKVYSSDSTGPKESWLNPADGSSITGRTTYVGFASSDDHAVREMEVLLDGVVVTTVICRGITFDCQASYGWSIRRVHGEHSATFISTDWMGNATSKTVTFTVE
jgi:hypothetical protein